MKHFEEMEVWQLSRRLTVEIYQISESRRFRNDFSLRRQMQRAAVSILSNIAEGFERGSSKAFIHHLQIARGSAGELRAQLYIALDLRYLEKNDFKKLYADVVSISRQLGGFIQYLRDRPD